MYMKTRKKKEVPIFISNPDVGLSNEQVQIRVASKLTNKTKKIIGKSFLEIIITNVFTFYNLLLAVIAAFLIVAHRYTSLFFAIVYILNIAIGLYQDFKANYLLSKLQILVEPHIIVIRNGEEIRISTNDIVRDDIVILKSGNQISADGIIVEGEIGVDESLITGEARPVFKKAGEEIFSGSYVFNGTAKVRVMHVGKDNYATELQRLAKAKRTKASKLQKSLKTLFKVIGAIVTVLGIITLIVRFDEIQHHFKDSIGTFAGSMVAMIPAGLYLLTSLSFTVGVVNLSKKRVLVQEFYSLEMLARSTMLCLDKTGTITDGTMTVKELVNVSSMDTKEIELLISNIVRATKDENATAESLLRAYPYEQTEKPLEVLSFDSHNKFSGATFKKGTFVIGAIENLNIQNKTALISEADQYASKGYRVLVLAKTSSAIIDRKIEGSMKAVALIIIEDHIREDAKEIFRWFYDNDVKIRVISGDNVKAVAEIARRAGIRDAGNYVSLESMPLDEVRNIALNYTVFGRVSPEQKEVLVDEFKKAKEVVAMTGDGINDILALKKADCSIAMASGADAAKNVSQLVLLDSNFATLPSVVAEGRRVVNNIQRSSSLFLMKTIFAIFLSILFLFISIGTDLGYPFLTNHFYLWEITVIGVGAFFLAIEVNAEPINRKFLRNVFEKAVPGAIAIIIAVLSVYLIYITDVSGNEKVIVTMAAIIMALFPLVLFYEVARPLTKYRAIIFAGVIFMNLLTLLGISISGADFLEIDFSLLYAHNYVQILLIIVNCSVLYIGTNRIIEAIKKRGKKDD